MTRLPFALRGATPSQAGLIGSAGGRTKRNLAPSIAAIGGDYCAQLRFLTVEFLAIRTVNASDAEMENG
jgi:hypothetical protein